jgi:hypothetical protein
MGKRGPLRGQRHLDSYSGGEEAHEHRQSKGQKGGKTKRKATTAKAAKPIDISYEGLVLQTCVSGPRACWALV